jgi:hypothetical protein
MFRTRQHIVVFRELAILVALVSFIAHVVATYAMDDTDTGPEQ